MKYTADQAASDSLAAARQFLSADLDVIYADIRTAAAEPGTFSLTLSREVTGTQGVQMISALTRVLRDDGFELSDVQTSAGRYTLTVRW